MSDRASAVRRDGSRVSSPWDTALACGYPGPAHPLLFVGTRPAVLPPLSSWLCFLSFWAKNCLTPTRRSVQRWAQHDQVPASLTLEQGLLPLSSLTDLMSACALSPKILSCCSSDGGLFSTNTQCFVVNLLLKRRVLTRSFLASAEATGREFRCCAAPSPQSPLVCWAPHCCPLGTRPAYAMAGHRPTGKGWAELTLPSKFPGVQKACFTPNSGSCTCSLGTVHGTVPVLAHSSEVSEGKEESLQLAQQQEASEELDARLPQ